MKDILEIYENMRKEAQAQPIEDQLRPIIEDLLLIQQYIKRIAVRSDFLNDDFPLKSAIANFVQLASSLPGALSAQVNRE